MSTFSTPVVEITKVDAITLPDGSVATSIEVATVFGFQSVVKRGLYKAGDLAVYLPEASVLPQWLVEELGLTGKLAGPSKNRVKAARLLGVLSQGLLVPVEYGAGTHAHSYSVRMPRDPYYADDNSIQFKIGLVDIKLPNGDVAVRGISDDLPNIIGVDCSSQLGVVKYEPTVPPHMDGDIMALFGRTVKYDIENMQRYPTILEDNEQVVVTEKLHGTFTAIAYDPNLQNEDLLQLHTIHGDLHGSAFAYSKGLGEKGFVFQNVSRNDSNVYHKALLDNQERLSRLAEKFPGKPVHVFGETFGTGVQDLTYGMKGKDFRVFDIYVGTPTNGAYVDANIKYDLAKQAGFSVVPVLYQGPFVFGDVSNYRDGLDTINGAHMREGVVYTPLTERRNQEIGRVVLKAVSPAYHERKNKNATEYQ